MRKRRRGVPPKVLVQGDQVLLYRKSGWHNPIGRVHYSTADGAWSGCDIRRYCQRRKTKHQAVLFVVKRWQSYVGTGRRLDY